ncbi:unnamed protein product [Pleuronectes platessa]|uniref:Uncharacterized protein n=1 Tax=Pleuronectes platessa TaxID=8262 RepID=A0A9N7VA82_PLEPL|nr:unnamed protein product [Pleuronectes platessa]
MKRQRRLNVNGHTPSLRLFCRELTYIHCTHIPIASSPPPLSNKSEGRSRRERGEEGCERSHLCEYGDAREAAQQLLRRQAACGPELTDPSSSQTTTDDFVVASAECPSDDEDIDPCEPSSAHPHQDTLGEHTVFV